ASSRAAHDANVPEKVGQVTLKVVPEAIGNSPSTPEAGSWRDHVLLSNCTPEIVSKSESTCHPGNQRDGTKAVIKYVFHTVQPSFLE
ncbi:hypothetical protein L914_20215, partial [Phytophthora nicotianae]